MSDFGIGLAGLALFFLSFLQIFLYIVFFAIIGLGWILSHFIVYMIYATKDWQWRRLGKGFVLEPSARRVEELGVRLIGRYQISTQDYLDGGIEIPRSFDDVNLEACRHWLSQHGFCCDAGEVTVYGSRRVKLWRRRQVIF